MGAATAGARGSILLERSTDAQPGATGDATPLDDVLAQLWQELDQRPAGDPGCTASCGAQIGCAMCAKFLMSLLVQSEEGTGQSLCPPARSCTGFVSSKLCQQSRE